MLSSPFTINDIKTKQLEKINEVLSYVKEKSPFYKERLPFFRAESFKEFENLPFTTPNDIKQYGYKMVCVKMDDIDRVVTVMETSGSTGASKKLYFTAKDQEFIIDYFMHGMMEFADKGDNVLILFPGRAEGSLNDLLSKSLRRMGANPFVFGFPSEDQYEEVLKQILQDDISYLVGPASLLAKLARLSLKLKISGKISDNLMAVLCAAAFVSDENKNAIETIWSCRVDEHYGMTETSLAGAIGLRGMEGYHPWESGLYYEIINPVTGEVLPDGEEGELVVTTLNREGMPLIRYKTGDMSAFIPGGSPDGSVLRRLKRVSDRKTEKKFLRKEWKDDKR